MGPPPLRRNTHLTERRQILAVWWSRWCIVLIRPRPGGSLLHSNLQPRRRQRCDWLFDLGEKRRYKEAEETQRQQRTAGMIWNRSVDPDADSGVFMELLIKAAANDYFHLSPIFSFNCFLYEMLKQCGTMAFRISHWGLQRVQSWRFLMCRHFWQRKSRKSSHLRNWNQTTFGFLFDHSMFSIITLIIIMILFTFVVFSSSHLIFLAVVCQCGNAEHTKRRKRCNLW